MEVDNSRMFLARVVRVVTTPKGDPPAGPATKSSRTARRAVAGFEHILELGGA
ncbi:hypothetical protein [Nocardia barduliensis]|uniref:hypothetical protein n=1 Tax=Nocardia barduliensis TaxID=2736643 RepID=UPI0015735ADB|nr:hypothetical protein [Nocardia barduliensis]